MRTNIKKLLSCLSACVLGLITLFAMSFDLLYYGVDKLNISETGFKMLDFKSDLIVSSYQWGASAMGFLNVLQLIVAIATIVLPLVAIFTMRKSKAKKLCTSLMFVSEVFLFLYMLEGIVFCEIYKGNDNTIIKSLFHTQAYIPLILSVIPIIAYAVIQKFSVEKFKKSLAQLAELDKEDEREEHIAQTEREELRRLEQQNDMDVERELTAKRIERYRLAELADAECIRQLRETRSAQQKTAAALYKDDSVQDDVDSKI